MPFAPTSPTVVQIGSIPEGKVADFLTGKLVKDTPEEYVRQNLEKAITRQYRYAPIADTFIPDWYKRHYVTEEHGRRIVSGRQLLQTKPVNMQYIAARSLDYSAYELRENTIAFGSRGRAEERMSVPALITADRANWLASENVIRVRPREGISPGWLYLCFASWQIQAQVQASTHGAVVDVIDPRRLDEVLLPPPDYSYGKSTLECWSDFAMANALEAEAIALVEAEILRKVGVKI